MSSRIWTDAELDLMRTVGDPMADAVVTSLFAEGGIESVNALMRTLVVNDGMPSHLLPVVVRDYLSQTSSAVAVDPEQVARGEAMFGLWGPEMLLVLGFYALPADYAAKKGVQVLFRTGRLTAQPVRRVFETTQMVVDVMSPGGLAPTGDGVRSAQKVRLMHAAVRHLLTHDANHPWDPALGTPINQEDLAGTLMSFSYLVLDGLSRLGVTLSDADRDAYFQAWMVIGRIMGVHEDLIPANLDEAMSLTKLIHQRQIAPSPQGVALAAALVEGYRGLMPELLKGTPVSLIHFFLDRDPFTGENIAAMLGLPPADWTACVAGFLVDVDRFFGQRSIQAWLPDRAISYVSRHLIEGMLLVERGGRRAPFTIPDTLKARWGVGVAARESA